MSPLQVFASLIARLSSPSSTSSTATTSCCASINAATSERVAGSKQIEVGQPHAGRGMRRRSMVGFCERAPNGLRSSPDRRRIVVAGCAVDLDCSD